MTGRRPFSSMAARVAPAQWLALLTIGAMVTAMVVIGLGRGPLSAPPDATGRWATPEDIDEFAQLRAEELNLAGLALVVIRDGEVYHSSYLGTAGDGRSVDDTTPFILGSTSKQFTALAVQRLVHDGRLSLDAIVAEILPGWSEADDPLRRITVRDLLAHTSGLTTTTGLEQWGWQTGRPDSIAANADDLADAPVAREPGEAYEYSNSNYDLLGAVVEQVTGLPFADAMAGLVTGPLGLLHTTAAPEAAAGDTVAAGHYPWLEAATLPTPSPSTPGAVPSAFQVSTAADLTRLLRAHMGEVETDLTDEVLAAAREPLTTIDAYSQYGSGWIVRPLRELRNTVGDPLGAGTGEPLPTCVHHLGSTYLSQSSLLACPTEGFGIVALTNTGPGIDTTRWAAFQSELTHVVLGTTVPYRLPNPVESNAPMVILGSLTVQTLSMVPLLGRGGRRRGVWAAVAVAVAAGALALWWSYAPCRLGCRIPFTAFWAGAPELGLATLITTLLAAVTFISVAVLAVRRLRARG